MTERIAISLQYRRLYGRIFTYEKTAKTIADVKMFMKNW